MKYKGLTRFAVAIAASALATGAANAATTVDWTFNGTSSGSGQITYDESTDLVTALSGTYDGGVLSLVNFVNKDPNNPDAEIYDNGNGRFTYRGVPNTGGANYSPDDLFHQTFLTSGYLASTGTGTNERVYVLNVDRNNTGAEQFNFFSINSDGSYRQDFGTFASTPASGAVPEPATWAMMLVGFGGIGFAMRRRTSKVRTTVAFA